MESAAEKICVVGIDPGVTTGMFVVKGGEGWEKASIQQWTGWAWAGFELGPARGWKAESSIAGEILEALHRVECRMVPGDEDGSGRGGVMAIVAMEDFVLYPETLNGSGSGGRGGMDRDLLAPVRIQARVQQMLWDGFDSSDRPRLIERMAQEAKSSVTDDKLRAALRLSGKGSAWMKGQKHARDAARHALRALKDEQNRVRELV